MKYGELFTDNMKKSANNFDFVCELFLVYLMESSQNLLTESL